MDAGGTKKQLSDQRLTEILDDLNTLSKEKLNKLIKYYFYQTTISSNT